VFRIHHANRLVPRLAIFRLTAIQLNAHRVLEHSGRSNETDAVFVPSTLVEAVFLTNNDEGARLAAGTRQGEIAQAIASGVMAYT